MPTQDTMTCGICGLGLLEELQGYRSMRRVTSDCRPWPAGGRLGLCNSCGAVQKPADDAFIAEIEDIYRSYAIYHQGGGAEQAVFEQAVFEQATGSPLARSAQLLKAFTASTALNAKGRMLDVGCGNGAMLKAFGDVAPSWMKAGTEFDAKYCREIEAIPRTEPLHVGGLEGVQGVFDLVTMIHVLEHVLDPLDALRTIRGKLKPDGVLLVEVPNHQKNPFELLIADHRTHFSTNSLARLLRLSGYDVDIITEN